jgi:peptidoglycan LD-endopeptidase LytH
LAKFNSSIFSPVMKPAVPYRPVDLSNGGYPSKVIDQEWLVGGYLENRQGMYTSDVFGGVRYIHLGIDFWAKAGTPVYAVADGVVYGCCDNSKELDYGPTLITEHDINGIKVYCLYGHLSRASIELRSAGEVIEKGQHLANLGSTGENGGWIPHLHFQLSLDRPEVIDMPGVCAADEVDKVRLTYPDPRLILGPLY